MIDANQIPDEVVEAAIDAMSDCGSEVIGSRMARASIVAALNAWPGSEYVYRQPHRRAVSYSSPAIILPLPQDGSDE